MAPLVFTATSLTTFSNAILNNKKANASPCRTPFLTLMGSDNLSCILTRYLALFIVALTRARGFIYK